MNGAALASSTSSTAVNAAAGGAGSSVDIVETLDTDAHPIIFFDGVCNFCAASVHFVLERERDQRLRFASLQSETAKRLLPPLGIDPADLDSVVVVEHGVAWTRSSAALKAASYLGFPWRLMPVFMIVPRFVRDAVYAVIARNRYRLFGKKDECMIPSPTLRARFLP